MKNTYFYTDEQEPKTLIVTIHAPYNRTANIESYLAEFHNLIRTNGNSYAHEYNLKLRTIDPSYFITKGKLHELKDLVDEHGIEHVIFSETLSPQQERNLTDYLDCTICDRTRLILEIFEKSAHSGEGKMQVEIAKLQYEKTRLAGKGIYMSQQSGVLGMRGGFGETLKEREKRHIEKTIDGLKKQLKKLEVIRDTQRKQRRNNQVPQICLIGYTNAGKSTILNALTNADVLAEDKLFATLDTTTRKLFINGKEKGVISDTVGFIQQLPPHLIEAFKSTLSELNYADLLLHIIDASDSNWQVHIRVVNDILEDLGVNKPILHVFNKCDRVENFESLKNEASAYQPYVMVDALSKPGLHLLIEYLDQWHRNGTTEIAPKIITVRS